MSNHHSKQVQAQVAATTRRAPVRPSRIGYWVCPSCNTINQAYVTVIHGTDSDPVTYTVPERITCKGSMCGHTFEALPPTPASVVVPQAT